MNNVNRKRMILPLIYIVQFTAKRIMLSRWLIERRVKTIVWHRRKAQRACIKRSWHRTQC